jgi:CIC family chloride channel protein
VEGTEWTSFLAEREEHVFLVLTLIIGALVGLPVMAFIVLTERFGARLYPVERASSRILTLPFVQH